VPPDAAPEAFPVSAPLDAVVADDGVVEDAPGGDEGDEDVPPDEELPA
jgi:hypothetical protein